MRDPKRIGPLLDVIKSIWEANPDMRLGQLLSNVLRDPALYYVEDEQLVRMLELYYKNSDKVKKYR